MSQIYDRLEERVDELKTKLPNHPIWNKIKEDPITSEYIDRLVEEGWKVKFYPPQKLSDEGAGSVDKNNKTIKVRGNLSIYERDITLLHEIVHIKYGEDSQYQYIAEEAEPFYGDLVTESLARELYKNKELLKKVICTLIFKETLPELSLMPRQLTFPF